MPKVDTNFRDMEEDRALTTAMALCGALDLPAEGSLDDMIMEAEINLDWRKTEARNIARGIKALRALRVTA